MNAHSHVDAGLEAALGNQFGAALDMLESAIRVCPDDLWRDQARTPQFWYVAYHTIFFLDYYLDGAGKGFVPPAPFTLGELDPSGVLPDRVYGKDELLAYLEYGRSKCYARIRALTSEQAQAQAQSPSRYGSIELTAWESLIYNLRHVQHHAGQLHLILRQTVDATPGWVDKSHLRPTEG